MNLPVDQANSGAKYEFCYVFMVKVKFLKSKVGISLHNNSYLGKAVKLRFQMHISNSLYNYWIVCYHGNKIQQYQIL